MPTAHIDAQGVITLIDPGSPEDAQAAEGGLYRLIVALAKMAIARESAGVQAGLDTRSGDTRG